MDSRSAQNLFRMTSTARGLMDSRCKKCGIDFLFSEEEQDLLKKIYPRIGERVFEIPPPQYCYECRLQQRFAWRNDMNLFQRTCDRSGEKIVSMFPPDSEMTVWHKDIWWSDQWDARDYGRDFDFNRSFGEQFGELVRAVPFAHVAVFEGENSLYTNYNLNNKNCYFCFGGNYLQDSMYCYMAESSKDCVDCYFVDQCELCYQCVQSESCYNLRYALHCKNCADSLFLEDCQSCRDCFLCFNLRQKQYCILNKQYSKEEYFAKLAEFELETNEGMRRAKERYATERLKYPKPENHNISVENCSGEYISEAKNCQECFNLLHGGEDCIKILNGFPNLKDALDCSYSGDNAELMYQTMASGADCSNIAFTCIAAVGSSNVYYSNLVIGCKNCFGCSNLRNAEFCILNKQYTKEQYNELLPRIIEHMIKTGEWGNYFDPKYSPSAYNHTLAQVHWPLDKVPAVRDGFSWSDYQAPAPVAEKIIKKEHVLPDIAEIPDEILDWAVECGESGKLFKITKAELAYYRKHKLAIPRFAFDRRHLKRIQIRNDYRLHQRNCAKCAKGILTAYSQERPELVYCLDCYRGDLY